MSNLNLEHTKYFQAQMGPEKTLWAKLREDMKACPVGMAFKLEQHETEGLAINTIRSYISRIAKSLGYSFTTTKHESGLVIARTEPKRSFIGSGNEPGAEENAEPAPPSQPWLDKPEEWDEFEGVHFPKDQSNRFEINNGIYNDLWPKEWADAHSKKQIAFIRSQGADIK